MLIVFRVIAVVIFLINYAHNSPWNEYFEVFKYNCFRSFICLSKPGSEKVIYGVTVNNLLKIKVSEEIFYC